MKNRSTQQLAQLNLQKVESDLSKFGGQVEKSESTGIYQAVTIKSGLDPRGWDLTLDYGFRDHNLEQVLFRHEMAALEIFAEHTDVETAKKARAILAKGSEVAKRAMTELSRHEKLPGGGSRFSRLPLSEGAPPIARDAQQLLSRLHGLRSALGRNDAYDVAIAALLVGSLSERIRVRPSEPVALDGRRHRQRMRERQIDLNGRPPEEQARRRQQARQLVAALRKAEPAAKAMWIYQQVAAQLVTTPRSVMRYLKKDERKRSDNS